VIDFQRSAIGTIKVSDNVWLEVQIATKRPGTDPFLEPDDLKEAGAALVFIAEAIEKWRETGGLDK
jgi:hypothetical protein